MNRRGFLRGAASLPLARYCSDAIAATPPHRVRPGEPGWPTPTQWDELRQQVGGRLVEVQSPLEPCREAPLGDACGTLFRELKNPYYIGDEVGLTQTTGWVDAWSLQPSVYAVAAESAADVAAAVDFARDRNLRLVVKGGGHSYLGTSNAPDSLLIWTRKMSRVELHDGFVAAGTSAAPQPAVTVGAGAIWMHTYNAVTTGGGRYVQGGGCGTVGVAGLVLGGGFGSYSKGFGSAAAGLLEAELVTADGKVRIANATSNPDLFWALKGGGGGSFGVVTRMTLRTHELPDFMGIVLATIEAHSDSAYRQLIGRFIAFYGERLLTPHWGELVTLGRANRLDIRMNFQGLDRQQAETLWQPFFQWIVGVEDYSFTLTPRIIAAEARHRWDPEWLRAHFPSAVLTDDRPGAPRDNIFWAANLAEAGHFIRGYESVWLPAALLAPEGRERLADALYTTSRIWPIELHFQKGLAGATGETIAASADTATNPAMLDAFALAIIGSEAGPAYPGLRGYSLDLAAARRDAERVARAMAELRKSIPDPGSYVAESSYFERDWRNCYWGRNYQRLAEIKRKYDPEGLFFVRHGVGSEEWSEDGFTRLAAR